MRVTLKQNVEFWSQWDGGCYPMVADWKYDENGQLEHIDCLLDRVFGMQGNSLKGNKVFPTIPTACAGDVVVVGGKAFYCSSIGWNGMTEDQFDTWKNSDVRDRSWLGREVFWPVSNDKEF